MKGLSNTEVEFKKSVAHEKSVYQDKSAKRILYPPLNISFWSARKGSNYLVKDRFYPLERKGRSCKCDNLRCHVCNKNEETDSTVTGESFKINCHLCCDDKCNVYLLICKVCKKQYIGKKFDKFFLHCTNYQKAMGNSKQLRN